MPEHGRTMAEGQRKREGAAKNTVERKEQYMSRMQQDMLGEL